MDYLDLGFDDIVLPGDLEAYHEIQVMEVRTPFRLRRLSAGALVEHVKGYADSIVSVLSSVVSGHMSNVGVHSIQETILLTLVNGWQDFDSATYSYASAGRIGQWGFLVGVIYGGTVNANIGTIDDAAYRPRGRRVCLTQDNAGAARVDVFPSGVVKYFGAQNTYLSLNISYPL